MSADANGIEWFDDPEQASPHYSQAVRHEDLIFTSGQFGVEIGGAPVPFPEQARIALRRAVEAVELAGGSRDTIISVRAYLRSMEDYAAWNEAYAEVLLGGPAKPVRTTVQIAAFLPPMLVELDVVAAAQRPSAAGAA
jgi:2-iminobutanoate/2-iminopropanoate deaminase